MTYSWPQAEPKFEPLSFDFSHVFFHHYGIGNAFPCTGNYRTWNFMLVCSCIPFPFSSQSQIPHSSRRPLRWPWLCPQQKWSESVESSPEESMPGLPGTLFPLAFFVLTEVRPGPWRRAFQGRRLGSWEKTKGSSLFLLTGIGGHGWALISPSLYQL